MIDSEMQIMGFLAKKELPKNYPFPVRRSGESVYEFTIGFNDRDALRFFDAFEEEEQILIRNMWGSMVNKLYYQLYAYYGGAPVEFSLVKRTDLLDKIMGHFDQEWYYELCTKIPMTQLMSMLTYSWQPTFWTSVPDKFFQNVPQSDPVDDTTVDSLIKLGVSKWWLYQENKYFGLQIYSMDLQRDDFIKLIQSTLEIDLMAPSASTISK